METKQTRRAATPVSIAEPALEGFCFWSVGENKIENRPKATEICWICWIWCLLSQMESRTSIVAPPDKQDVQFLSDNYDALVQSKTSLEEDLGRFSRRLDLLEKKFDRIDKGIDDIFYYSYQYNLKIVGVPQINENESAKDTANLYLKLFSSLGNDISASNIDIAHRVRLRNAATD